MNTCYLITADIDSAKFIEALESLKADVLNQAQISQIFLYSNAVVAASLDRYSQPVDDLVEISNENDINLYVCSAAFSKRQYKMSDIAQQDFHFMGLGQFIAESAHSNNIRVY